MIRIELEGSEDLDRYLEEIGPKVKAAVWDEMQVGGLNIESGAKRRCPVRKKAIRINGQLYSGGRLRSSIHASFFKQQSKVSVGTNVGYGPFVELGTVKMKAQPFLYPSFEEEKQPLISRIESAIGEALGGSR